MNVDVAWLTINRTCNLKCKWCYAQEFITQKRAMDVELALKLLDILAELGVEKVYLIGGEPTVHPHFFDILRLTIDRGFETVVVTNAVALSSENFCNTILSLNHPKLQFGISIKGATREDYIGNCGVDSFERVLSGIRNCDKFGFDYGLSYVLTTDNIDTIDTFAQEFHKHIPNKGITFALCNDVVLQNGEILKNNSHPLKIERVFKQKYDKLCSILDMQLSLHQTFPLCQCDKDLFNLMESRNQLYTSCHVHNRDGIIFDETGGLLLCNHLAGFQMGKYGVDFSDAESLIDYWDSDYLVELHRRLTTMPTEKCENCEESVFCGGGCCIQWFSNSFSSFEQYR